MTNIFRQEPEGDLVLLTLITQLFKSLNIESMQEVMVMVQDYRPMLKRVTVAAEDMPAPQMKNVLMKSMMSLVGPALKALSGKFMTIWANISLVISFIGKRILEEIKVLREPKKLLLSVILQGKDRVLSLKDKIHQ